MGNFLRWLGGSVDVSVGEEQIERFLNLCRNRGLFLYRIRHTETTYRFRMPLADYRQIRPIAKKTGVRPRIVRKSGLPFVIGEWKKKKVFAGGFLLFVTLLFFLTGMVWSIDIEGCGYHTEEALLEFLSEQGVRSGMFYRDLDYKKTEDMIRLAYGDISWVSVERVGTRLHIRLKESQMIETTVAEGEPSHLVASRDGVVTSIVTRKGTPLVKAGDEVKKGDILISGIVTVTGDFDAVVGNHLVCADGDVEVVSELPYYSVREMEYEKKIYSGKKRKSFCLSGFGWRLDFQLLPELPQLPWSKGDGAAVSGISSDGRVAESFAGGKMTKGGADSTDKVTFWQEYRFNKSLAFPISLYRTEYLSYDRMRFRYSEEEVKALEEKKFHDFLAQLEKKGVLIPENNVKIEVAGALCVSEGTVTVKTREERHREITENEWRETEPDEYNGNDS